ncbi:MULTISPECIES: hypothetical protein [unclassified Streptomyces]|uniref:hypothetical protein n=1 Tax=unclassified Streptomyces TaxID=2593676 RepID=UPI00159F07C2
MTRHHLRRPALFTAVSAVAGIAPTAAPATATWASSHAPARQASVGQVPSLRELSEPPDAVKARELLGDLVVADEDDVPGYSRAKFPHWITQYSTCDTREAVVQGVDQDGQCRAVSGTWFPEYSGTPATTPPSSATWIPVPACSKTAQHSPVRRPDNRAATASWAAVREQ